MKRILSYIPVSALVLLPSVASAQFGEIDTFFGGMTNLIQNTLIPIVMAVAFLVFIFGAVRFFLISQDDDSREKGKSLMLYGIIAFVLIVSIWGIVALIAGGLGFEDKSLDNIPKVP